MRPRIQDLYAARFGLVHIRNWIVNLTPKRVDSLPYSKIEGLCHTYRQRLLAARAAPVGSSDLPPATWFICQPTASYVLGPRLAARLSQPEMSMLASRLSVYQTVFTGNTMVGDVALTVEERESTPEVTVEPRLGDQALYYGQGQIHAVGMLDMQSTVVKKNIRFSSAADLQRRLAWQCFKDSNPTGFAHLAETSLDDSGTWLYRNSKQGPRKIARVSADIDDDIATASITFNLAVPTPGLDPARTCPYDRLAAVGVLESPSTTIWALDGKPASDQDQVSGCCSEFGDYGATLLGALQHAMCNGWLGGKEWVDHSRAFGASDPDLEPSD